MGPRAWLDRRGSMAPAGLPITNESSAANPSGCFHAPTPGAPLERSREEIQTAPFSENRRAPPLGQGWTLAVAYRRKARPGPVPQPGDHPLRRAVRPRSPGRNADAARPGILSLRRAVRPAPGDVLPGVS